MVAEYGLISSIARWLTFSKENATDGEKNSIMNGYNQLRALYNGPNSISKKAKQGIFEFPFLISSNIDSLDDITDIIKTMEIEYSNMVALSMGINPSVKSSTNAEIMRTLSNYHTNANDYGFDVRDSDYSYPKDHEASMYKMGMYESRSINDFLNNKIALEANNNDDENKKNCDEKIIASGLMIAKNYSTKYNMTMFTVKLRLGDDKNTEVTIPIGIRGIPHPVRHDDLSYVMSSFIKTRVGGVLNRFIRWKTGEIKGLHNLLFRYDEIKKDAEFERRVGTDNSWLSVLKSRANNRKVNILTKLFSNGHVDTREILPNCTFLINLADVDAIENITSINLFTNVTAARKFLDDSMGLGICILDEAHNTIHILYSGWDKYESRNIKSLKSKDNTKDEMNALLTLMKKANGGISI